MLLELGVPQGTVATRQGGGPGVMEKMLDTARSSVFTGYLKVILAKDGERSESLLSISGGTPALCLYVFRPVGMEEIWFLGDKAAEYMWYDASRPEAFLTAHSDVSLKDFEQLFPGARIRRVDAPRHPLPHDRVRADKLHRAEPENTGEHVLMAMGSSSDDMVERQAQGVYDLILQYHKMHSSAPGVNVCDDCGGPIDLLGYCPKCASREDSGPMVDRMDPRHTFASFVVGPGSRFAEAAARAVAAEPGRKYNPLTIHGRSGMGKTHLLQAIGHHLKKARREMSITFLPLETLDDPLDSKHPGLRQEMESAEVLLLDDLQYLTGKERLQEDLLRAVNRLVAAGRQVVMTADRSPREIALSDRFASRIESGLIADIGPLDQATRVAILKKAAQNKAPDDVLELLASMCPENVRQLEGGMTRVLAFASLMGTGVTMDLAREVLGAAKAPEAEKGEKAGEVVEVGRSYIVEEPRPDRTYDLLAAQIDKGLRALVFSRNNPTKVSERLQGRKAEIYWLTERESKGSRTIPPSLEKIVLLAEEHIQREGASIVMLDDLHYLISNATFEGVIRFIRSLVDQVSERDAVFMVSVSADSLKVQERSVLERELEPIKP